MLSEITEIKVRFNEVDPLGITWHGHYLRYFEDGREAFGAKYGLGYLEMYKLGFVVPIVNINCNYKKSLQYGDKAIIETTFIDNPAAKIIFEYKIYNPETLEIISVGKSVQVFLDIHTKQLQIKTPEFFENWKINNNLI
ncbi:MAG: acyl-CoA thioesterase [Bacteroidetes bacterium]|nr:acyl-CoA thioesterase [Bacteroidota bacterium]HET6244608.1 acyl-CoA thioesterase [Bacteroidia bacterium]